MNADGSREVAADVSVAAKSDLILWVAIGSLVAGLLLGELAALLIMRGSRRTLS
jgi:NhaP-type Na+/H+ or K+/H+ antiporter